MSLSNFLNLLSTRESSDVVFNQYRNKDILNNLKLYFEHLIINNPRTLLIAEAPGYRGCRITGIPFSSGQLIKDSRHKIFNEIKNQIVLKEIMPENTATIFWDTIPVDYSPLLWNTFPFHPHKKDNPLSNRKPAREEVEEGKKYILSLIDIFKPKKLFALGRVGELTLKQMFPEKEITYIRHPSYGGKKDFIEGIKLLKIQ